MAQKTKAGGHYHRLEEDDHQETCAACVANNARNCCWRGRFYVLLACYLLTIITVVGLMIPYQRILDRSSYQRTSALETSWSPADSHLVYEARSIMRGPDSMKFMGHPRPELDNAWHDLLQGTLIRVSKEELEAANQTSIALEDGGYGVGLGVSHSLHCLSRIHKYVNKSYYFPGDQGQYDWPELRFHVDHCIESLRQVVLCQVDTTVYPLMWTKESKSGPAVRPPHARSCVNFDLLHQWMLGRAASIKHLVKEPDSFYDTD